MSLLAELEELQRCLEGSADSDTDEVKRHHMSDVSLADASPTIKGNKHGGGLLSVPGYPSLAEVMMDVDKELSCKTFDVEDSVPCSMIDKFSLDHDAASIEQEPRILLQDTELTVENPKPASNKDQTSKEEEQDKTKSGEAVVTSTVKVEEDVGVLVVNETLPSEDQPVTEAKQDEPEPAKQDEKEPAKQDEPAILDEPESAKQDNHEPAKQDEPEPTKQDEVKPAKQDKQEPAKQDESEPTKQDKPEKEDTEAKDQETQETEAKDQEKQETEAKDQEKQETEAKDQEKQETEAKDQEKQETEAKDQETDPIKHDKLDSGPEKQEKMGLEKQEYPDKDLKEAEIKAKEKEELDTHKEKKQELNSQETDVKKPALTQSKEKPPSPVKQEKAKPVQLKAPPTVAKEEKLKVRVNSFPSPVFLKPGLIKIPSPTVHANKPRTLPELQRVVVGSRKPSSSKIEEVKVSNGRPVIRISPSKSPPSGVVAVKGSPAHQVVLYKKGPPAILRKAPEVKTVHLPLHIQTKIGSPLYTGKVSELPPRPAALVTKQSEGLSLFRPILPKPDLTKRKLADSESPTSAKRSKTDQEQPTTTLTLVGDANRQSPKSMFLKRVDGVPLIRKRESPSKTTGRFVGPASKRPKTFVEEELLGVNPNVPTKMLISPSMEVTISPHGVAENVQDVGNNVPRKELMDARVVVKKLNIPIPEYLLYTLRTTSGTDDMKPLLLQKTLEVVSQDLEATLAPSPEKKKGGRPKVLGPIKKNILLKRTALPQKPLQQKAGTILLPKPVTRLVLPQKGSMTYKKLQQQQQHRREKINLNAKHGRPPKKLKPKKQQLHSARLLASRKKPMQLRPFVPSIVARIGAKKRIARSKKVVSSKKTAVTRRKPGPSVLSRSVRLAARVRATKPEGKRKPEVKKVVKPEVKKKVVKPEVMKKVVKPEGKKKVVKPEVMKKVVKPEVMKKVVKPEGKKKVVKPEVMKKVVKPEGMKKVVKPEGKKKVVKPEGKKKIMKPEGKKKVAVTKGTAVVNVKTRKTDSPKIPTTKSVTKEKKGKQVGNIVKNNLLPDNSENTGEDEWIVEVLLDEAELDMMAGNSVSVSRVSSSDNRPSVVECDSSTDGKSDRLSAKTIKSKQQPATCPVRKEQMSNEMKMTEMRKAISDLERIADRSMLRLKAEERQVAYLAAKLGQYETDKHYSMLRKVIEDAAQNPDAAFILDLLLSYCPNEEHSNTG